MSDRLFPEIQALTPRQDAVFRVLLDYWSRQNMPPSLGEMCAQLGVSSRNGVYKHLQALVRKRRVEVRLTTGRGGLRIVYLPLNRAPTLERTDAEHFRVVSIGPGVEMSWGQARNWLIGQLRRLDAEAG